MEYKILDYIKEYGDAKAIVHRDVVYTYNQLQEKITFWRATLKDKLQPQAVVGIESDFSLASIALIFFLLENSYIIVPLDIKQRDKNTVKYDIAGLDVLITIPSTDIFTIDSFEKSAIVNPFYQTLRQENVPGLVIFTSGSSGVPKAAVHNLTKLVKKFDKKRKTFITVNFLLFDHWGGLNTMFHILANGGLLVVLEDRSPDYVCELIQKHKVELLPTSPTFLNMLLISRAYKRWSLESLKLITYGAEPMPETLLQMLSEVFPNIQLQQTYGLIELGVLSSKSESNNSLWVKIGGEGYAIRVVEGLLEIKSDSAMLGYINAPSPYTEDGWFKTGDAVEVNGDYFRILGRKSELINVGGEKVFPQEVENVILELDNIKDVVVYGEKHPLTGSIVCAKVSLLSDGLPDKEVIKLIKTHCRSRLSTFKVPVKILVVQEEFQTQRFKKERVKWN